MFHFMDILIVAGIALAIFGPKALQSVARSAGKGVGQAKQAKDALMAEIPIEDITNVTNHVPQIPLNSRQAVQMLLSTDEPAKASASETVTAPEKAGPSQNSSEK